MAGPTGNFAYLEVDADLLGTALNLFLHLPHSQLSVVRQPQRMKVCSLSVGGRDGYIGLATALRDQATPVFLRLVIKAERLCGLWLWHCGYCDGFGDKDVGGLVLVLSGALGCLLEGLGKLRIEHWVLLVQLIELEAVAWLVGRPFALALALGSPNEILVL